MCSFGDENRLGFFYAGQSKLVIQSIHSETMYVTIVTFSYQQRHITYNVMLKLLPHLIYYSIYHFAFSQTQVTCSTFDFTFKCYSYIGSYKNCHKGTKMSTRIIFGSQSV